MAATSLFVIFLLSIVTISQASVNIDCGSSLSSLDENNIKWVGDKDFIKTGVSSTVSSTTVENSLTTLRYFPTGESNCYSNIPVTKGEKVLVRTMFYYGNYDGKSSTPTFAVVFEGKHRETMTISSAFEYYISELIFAPTGEDISVCFVRTSSSSNPFVSSIEVVELDSGMYDELGLGEGLFYQQRLAYGTTEVIRSDPHGRFWLPSELNILLTGITSSAPSIDTSDASNKPPESVLRNSWSLEDLSLSDPTLPTKGVPVYLAMYFSEPLETSVRSFNIFFGGKQVSKSPVVPEFGKATQIVVRDVVASSSTEILFKSTVDALLPPMINAVELYVISTGISGNGSSGSGGSGGGGGGGGSSGSGGSGSEGRSKTKKSSKLPAILGGIFGVAILLIAYVFISITLANRRKASQQALALPTSTVAHIGTGSSPLFGQQMGTDSSQPTNETDMGDIDDFIGVNQSYVTQ